MCVYLIPRCYRLFGAKFCINVFVCTVCTYHPVVILRHIACSRTLTRRFCFDHPTVFEQICPIYYLAMTCFCSLGVCISYLPTQSILVNQRQVKYLRIDVFIQKKIEREVFRSNAGTHTHIRARTVNLYARLLQGSAGRSIQFQSVIPD